MKVLDFVYFVGDIIGGVVLDLFGQGHCALSDNIKSHFLTELFGGNQRRSSCQNGLWPESDFCKTRTQCVKIFNKKNWSRSEIFSFFRCRVDEYPAIY